MLRSVIRGHITGCKVKVYSIFFWWNKLFFIGYLVSRDGDGYTAAGSGNAEMRFFGKIWFSAHVRVCFACCATGAL